MPAGATYEPIATTSISSSSYTFSSFPSTYTDLVLVAVGTSSGTNINYGLRLNGDASSIYGVTRIIGDGSTASSDGVNTFTNTTFTSNYHSNQATSVYNIMSYSSSSVNKNIICTASNNNGAVLYSVSCYRSNSAITSIEFLTTTSFAFTGTLTLYGIAAA